jgi:hypothetical protein
MNCPECSSYNKAKGTKKCLTCPQYLDVIKASGKRSTICIDTVPDMILEAIPDNKTTTVYDALRQLPLEYSIPLIAYHLLNANQRELATYFKCSQQHLSKLLKTAISILREVPIDD